MESPRIQISKQSEFKKEPLTKEQFTISFNEHPIHSNCSCDLCLNDVKPIHNNYEQRETHPTEVHIPPHEALFYILKRCSIYKGVLNIAETIFLHEGTLCYSNEFGKIRIKDNVTNMEAKKFLEEKKNKGKYGFKNSEKDKEVYVMVYKNGFQQIMNEAHFNKVLAKRKNDTFWEEVSYSFKMPEVKENQETLKIFHYKRTKSHAAYMISVLEKVIKEVDSEDENNHEREELSRNLSVISAETSLPRERTQEFQLRNSQFLDPNLGASSIRLSNSRIRIPIPSAKIMIEEMIAYLEVTSKIRVLEAEIEYTEDTEGQPVLTGLRTLIIYEIPPEKETYLHDRYHQLDILGEKELAMMKKEFDQKEEETLWKTCTEILSDCLEKRRIELKIDFSQLEKQSDKNLREIFLKFFPNFLPSSIFMNKNWRNELSKFRSDTKESIHNFIRTDEGISILKRFNVKFYRTF